VLVVSWRALLVVCVAVVATASADWAQYGGDAGRHGIADGGAPEWPDVSYHRFLAAQPDTHLSSPIIVGEYAYLLVNATTLVNVQFSANGAGGADLYRLHIPTAEIEHLQHFSVPLYELAYHEGALYASGHNEIARLAADGSIEWRQPVRVTLGSEVPQRPQTTSGPSCGPPLVEDDVVLVACVDATTTRRLAVVDAFTHDGVRRPGYPFVPRPNDATGCPVSSENLLDPQAGCIWGTALTAANPAMPGGPVAVQLSRAGAWVYLVAHSAGDTGTPLTSGQGNPLFAYGGYEIHAIDPERAEGQRIFAADSHYPADMPCCEFAPVIAPPPVSVGPWLFVTAGDVFRFDAISPVPWEHDRRSVWQSDRIHLGAHMVPVGGELVIATASRLHRLTTDLEDAFGFTTFELPPDEAWVGGPMILAGDVLMARSQRALHTGTGPNIVHAIDATTGAALWRFPLGAATTFAAADGALIVLDEAGTVTVLGQTPASLHPSIRVQRYPAPGEPVVADLSGSRDGAFGKPARYRADWGDGTASGWQADPILAHRYAAAVDAPARFFVRNDANQTASIPITFHVGQQDPAKNILNAPFDPEFQETSFFLLGLFATGLVAAFGVYRAGRKRRNLRHELHDLEADYKRLQHDSMATEAMLAESRARARALFLERRLEEAHSAFLVSRIEELRHGLRLAEVEQRLDYLPHGMVKALREMLRDTRVTDWERNQFLEALERDRVLTAGQKHKVRDLIEGWFARDSRAGR
jgi:outer membrane protein assembly factor BamB